MKKFIGYTFLILLVIVIFAGDFSESDSAGQTTDAVTEVPEFTVTEIQTILAENNYNPGPIDGVLGDQTVTAIETFQEVNGLYVTGKANRATRKALADPKEFVGTAKLESLDSVFRTGFKTVLNIDATFKNTHRHSVRDLEVHCDVKAKTGTVLQTIREVVYERIPANSTIKVTDIRMGFAHSDLSSASCWVDDYVVEK